MNNNIKKFITFFLGNTILSIINFFMLPLYSKYISTKEFGVYSILMLFMSMTTILVDFGLTSTFSIKYHKITAEGKGKYILSTFIFNTIVVVILFIIFGIDIRIFNSIFMVKINSFILYKMLFIIFLNVIGAFMMNLLILEQSAILYSILSISRALAFALLNIYFLVYLKKGYIAYLDSTIYSQLIICVPMTIYVFKKYNMKNKSYFEVLKGENIKNSISLIAHNLAGNLSEWSGRYIINILMNASALGIYNMSYRFGSFFYSFVFSPLGQAEWPIIAKSFNQSKEEFVGKIKIFLRINLAICYTVAVMMFLVLDSYFFYFIDKSYWESYKYISYIVLGFITLIGYQSITAPFMLYEKTKYIPIFTALSSIINICLSYLFIRKIGILGASITYIFVNVIMFILIVKILSRKWNIKLDVVRNLLEYIVYSSLLLLLSNTSELKEICIEIVMKKIIIVILHILILILFFKNKFKKGWGIK